MTPLEMLLHRMKQHKHSGKKVLSVDYIIQQIETDMEKEAHRTNFSRGSVGYPIHRTRLPQTAHRRSQAHV